MKVLGPLCILATLLVWGNVSHACDASQNADLHINRVQQPIDAEIAAYVLAIDEELRADAHRDAEPAFSESLSLLDHEGESSAVVALAELAVPDQSDRDAVIEPVVSLTDAPIRRFLVEDEDVATISSVHGGVSDPETTSSTVTLPAESEMAPNGLEDR